VCERKPSPHLLLCPQLPQHRHPPQASAHGKMSTTNSQPSTPSSSNSQQDRAQMSHDHHTNLQSPTIRGPSPQRRSHRGPLPTLHPPCSHKQIKAELEHPGTPLPCQTAYPKPNQSLQTVSANSLHTTQGHVRASRGPEALQRPMRHDMGGTMGGESREEGIKRMGGQTRAVGNPHSRSEMRRVSPTATQQPHRLASRAS